MRNLMICVSVMLAIYLVWPLAFGSGGGRRAEAAVVTVVKPEPKPVAIASTQVDAPRPESCRKRFDREVQLCAANAGCRLSAGDHWDMCEVTGFWPN